MADRAVQLPDPDKLIVSSSPHYHGHEDVSRIMLLVVITLVPACVAGLIFFGWNALRVLAVCTASCVITEAVLAHLMRKPTQVRDMSAVLTGILLGMNLAAGTPTWVCIVGSVLAIGLGKAIYGGLGFNSFNPALVGRVALLIACPKALTTWVPPTGNHWALDAVTTATPLGQLKTSGPAAIQHYDLSDLIMGNIGGCIGETCALALLIGGVLLIAMKLIRWQVPVFFIGTVFAITGIAHAVSPETTAAPQFHIFAGGLFLGAFFMATDMVTSPMSKTGAMVFGIGCGLITAVIRLWGDYPEGVSFAILFMNALTPLIDRWTAAKPFGAAERPEAKGPSTS